MSRQRHGFIEELAAIAVRLAEPVEKKNAGERARAFGLDEVCLDAAVPGLVGRVVQVPDSDALPVVGDFSRRSDGIEEPYAKTVLLIPVPSVSCKPAGRTQAASKQPKTMDPCLKCAIPIMFWLLARKDLGSSQGAAVRFTWRPFRLCRQAARRRRGSMPAAHKS